jgi:hypothetical protein
VNNNYNPMINDDYVYDDDLETSKRRFHYTSFYSFFLSMFLPLVSLWSERQNVEGNCFCSTVSFLLSFSSQ